MSDAAERRRRAEGIADAILALATDERAAYLSETCREDDALRAEVAQVLSSRVVSSAADHDDSPASAGETVLPPALEESSRTDPRAGWIEPTVRVAREHWAGTIAAAALVTFLAAWGIGASALFVWESRARREAERQAARSQAIASLFEGLFASELSQPADLDPTASSLLDAGRNRISELAGGQPEIEATLRYRLGQANLRRARFNAGESLLNSALELQRTLLGEDHIDVARTMGAVATALWARADHERAESLFRQALEVSRNSVPANQEETILALNNLAALLRSRQRSREAEALLREALALLGPVERSPNPQRITLLTNLAALQGEAGHFAEAENYYRQALEILEATSGDESGATGRTLHDLALLTVRARSCEDALPLLTKVVTMYSARFGSGHWRVAFARADMGACLEIEGRQEEAEQAFLGAFAALSNAFGGQDRRTLTAARRLSRFYEAWDKPDLAGKYRAKLQEEAKGSPVSP